MKPLYAPGDSLLHRLNPLTKLAGFVLLLMAAYTLPSPWGALGVSGLLLALAASAGVLGALLRGVLLVLAPLLFSLLVIQGLLFPPARTIPLLHLGFVTLWADGFLFALDISTGLLAMALNVVLLVTTTHPADLVFSLTGAGLPRSIGYILLVALQLVPDMSARATAIQEAQRSRGLETSGLLNRLRALPPLVSPLIVGALLDVEERAMALESRAFTASGPKTSLRELHDSWAQRAARWLMLALAALLFVGGFTFLRGVS